MLPAVPILPDVVSRRGRLQMRCADAHPVGCSAEQDGDTFDELVAWAQDHGATAHGFTPAWYTPRRIAAMAASVTLSAPQR